MAEMRVEIIIPAVLPGWWKDLAVKRYAKYASPCTILHGTDLSALDKLEDRPMAKLVLEKAAQAAARGADACIIDCFGDPGLELCVREIKIPVIGVGMAGMLVASGLLRKFAIITSEQAAVRAIQKNAIRYGVATHLYTVASIDIPPVEVPKRQDEVRERLVETAISLCEEVKVLLLGCTELAEYTDYLKPKLAAKNAKIINPIATAIKLAETRAILGV